MPPLTAQLAFDVAHALGGAMLVVSFGLLGQRRIAALINVFAAQAFLLACAVAWQAFAQEAPHLLVTAGTALVVKAVAVPMALRRIVRRLDLHRSIESVVGVGTTMAAGVAVTGLSLAVVLPATEQAAAIAREDLAFALAILLLGLLMMIARRNAVSQVVGFMSLENGLILAAAAAKGMPLVVEITTAFAVLIAFILFGVFFFRIRERFDSLDVTHLERFRGESA